MADSSNPQHRELDRKYHDEIGSEYDDVILEPRSVASDLLFSRLGKHLPVSGRMLDIGCGTGQAILRFGSNFDHVDAVDHSAGMLKVAQANVGRMKWESKVRFHHENLVEWLGNCNQQYQLITCIGCLHHLLHDELVEVMQSMHRLVDSSGSILIAEPVLLNGNLEPWLISKWNAKSIAVHRGYRTQPEEPDEQPLPPGRLEKIASGADLALVDTASTWEIFNRSTNPGFLERQAIKLLCLLGGPGIVTAWVLKKREND